MELVYEFIDNEIFEKEIELKPKDENIVLEKTIENKDVESQGTLRPG